MEQPAALDPHHHADVSGGWLRAATFGAMDGLVSNIALIAGMGGGGASRQTVVLAGMAGLVAGAISMALGEYTSVRTQNEQVAAEVEKERVELARHPNAEADELARMWAQQGVPEDVARQLANLIKDHPDLALRIHVQEELGVSATDSPSPWLAAVSSFGCFAVGALLPLLPYLLGASELWLALAVGGVGLFAVGATAARFTRRPWWRIGARQFLFGAAAAVATYLVGLAIGVTTS